MTWSRIGLARTRSGDVFLAWRKPGADGQPEYRVEPPLTHPAPTRAGHPSLLLQLRLKGCVSFTS